MPGAAAAWRSGFQSAWLRPHAFEVLTALSVTATVLLLRGSGLALGLDSVTYTVGQLAWPIGRALLLGVALQALRAAFLRRLRAYLDVALTPRWLLFGVRAWLACVAIVYGYMWLKVSVPLLDWRNLDGVLWDLDVALHFGYSPTIFLTELFRGTVILGWLDAFYEAWLPLSLGGLAFFAALGDRRLRARFLFSHAALWVLGAWLYLALPALGPCYAHPRSLAAVRSEIPRADATQRRLAENYRKVVAGRTGPVASFNPALGIAAMPSLHVGVLWLLALWARRAARELFVVLTAATVLTFMGSVVTGWHYAIDGYVGIALGQACYGLSLLVERDRPPAPGAEGDPVAPEVRAAG